MKIILTLSLSSMFLLSYPLLAASPTVAQPTASSEKYINNETHYTIRYPGHWQKKEVPKLDLVLFAPPREGSDQTQASMNIISEDIGSPLSLDDFYSASVANLSSELKEVNIESSGKSSLNGTPSKWILYSHVMQGIKFKVLQYFITSQNFVYLLTFSSIADSFDDYRVLFETMASSFHLNEGDTAKNPGEGTKNANGETKDSTQKKTSPLN